MANRLQEESFSRSRSHTTSFSSSVDRSTVMFSRALYRTESAPLYRNYVPSLYKNPDPEITRKLEAFLHKPPLNSPENTGTSRSTSRESLERPRVLGKGLSYECEPVADRFRHLLPEKRTIHQLMLPPIMEGCRDNFNHFYKNPSNEDEVLNEDLSEQFLRLKYCRYLRHGPNSGYKRRTEKI